jgi:hypothetical protein
MGRVTAIERVFALLKELCMRILSVVLWFSFVITTVCSAQSFHLPPSKHIELKAENGLVLAWDTNSENRESPQIDIYDKEGKPLVNLTPLRLVPEAKRASVHDVSALPQRMIAVAVTYRKSNDTVPASSLLYYDFRGNLLSALALDPSREIAYLTIDDQANVWTLTMGAGGRHPSDVPMVVVYGPSGNVTKAMLKRADFPPHTNFTQEDESIGVPNVGHGADVFWFWLPGSTDLVLVNVKSFSVERISTGLPQRSGREVPLKIVRSDSGSLLAEIMSKPDDRHPGEFGFFVWSATTKRWDRVNAPCVHCVIGK